MSTRSSRGSAGAAAALGDEDRRARTEYHDAWRASLARISIPGNPDADRILARAVEDVASFPMLEGERDEWLAVQAGVPLYPAFFGRDALAAGWQAGMLDSGGMLDAALTRLGRLQGDRVLETRAGRTAGTRSCTTTARPSRRRSPPARSRAIGTRPRC